MRKLELLREKVGILEKFGLLHYRPHKKQDQFHRAGSFKRRMVRAGNRFGKSQMGCAEDSAWLLGERVWYPKTDHARKAGIPQRPLNGLVITTNFDKVDEVWTSQRGKPGKIWQYLPADSIKSTTRNSSGVIDGIYLRNGSQLTFNTVRSWENDPQSSESVDYDFIHVDEPCPEKMWTAESRGLVDRNGSAWFTLTPLSEVWINDMFFPRRNRESTDREVQQGNRWAIHGSMYDNPYLSVEAIKEFENSLSDDEKQCRIFGLPLELSGLVYKEFDWDRHVLQKVPEGWKSYNQPPANYTIYYAIDPHPQTPHAVLFCAVSPLGQRFFWSEIFHHTTIDVLSTQILKTVEGYYVARAKCDPLAYINDPITGTNIEEEFCRHGVFVEKATKALSTGILKVKEELVKENNLYFSPHLEETLWEFERYVWDEKTNKPKDENDHMMENIYRLLLDDPRYIDRKRISNKVEELVIDRAEIELPDFSLD